MVVKRVFYRYVCVFLIIIYLIFSMLNLENQKIFIFKDLKDIFLYYYNNIMIYVFFQFGYKIIKVFFIYKNYWMELDN